MQRPSASWKEMSPLVCLSWSLCSVHQSVVLFFVRDAHDKTQLTLPIGVKFRNTRLQMEQWQQNASIAALRLQGANRCGQDRPRLGQGRQEASGGACILLRQG